MHEKKDVITAVTENYNIEMNQKINGRNKSSINVNTFFFNFSSSNNSQHVSNLSQSRTIHQQIVEKNNQNWLRSYKI